MLLRNFNILTGDPENREVFSRPPLVAYRRDSNLRDMLIVIKKAFSYQTSVLVYCISCRSCPAIYIGGKGRTLRQRFVEHLRSIEKNLPGFPVAEHFNRAGLSIHDALVRGIMLCGENVQRKCLEIFIFSTWHQSSARL